MAGRGNCRRTTAACTGSTQGREVEEREVQQTMPMCRHVNLTPDRMGGSMERQLCELRQLMCDQNRLLEELLRVTREQNG